MTSIGRRDLLFFGSGITVALLAAGCGIGPVEPTPTPSPTTSPAGREPYLTIVQGTVGTLGSARVGYVDRAESVDQVSIWRDGNDESGFESTVSLGDGDRAFIGGECWTMSRLAPAYGRARIGFDPVLTKVESPASDAGLIYLPAGPDDAVTSARIGTGNRTALVELTARSAVIRHWPGLSKPGEAGVLLPVKAGSKIKLGRVTLTVTGFRPSLDRLRGYLVVRTATS